MRAIGCAVLFGALVVLSVAAAQAQTVDESQTQAQQLFSRGEYTKALAKQRAVVAAIEKAEIADTGTPGARTADALVNVSWYALFARAYSDALTASERAHKLSPGNLAAETNRAHALLFVGRVGEARKLYLAHKGKKLGQGTDVIWEETIADDFDALQAAGIKHAAFSEIIAALGMTTLDREIAGARREAQQLFAQGKYGEGEIAAKRYVDLARQRFGEARPEFAAALNELALSKMRLGHIPEAEALFKQAIAISEKTLGPDSLDLGERLSNLGVLYESQRRYPEAEALFKRYAAMLEKARGPDDIALARPLYNLGFVNRSWRRYASAEPFFKRALAIAEKAYGRDDEQVRLYVDGLALLYLAWGRFVDADAFHKRVIAIDEKAFGSDDVEFADRLNAIGVRLAEDGRNADAEPLFWRALTISEKTLGADDAKVGVILRSLGLVYERRNRYAQAEPLFKRSIVIAEKHSGPVDREVGRRVANLAVLYRKQRRVAEAEPLFQRALHIAEKTAGPQSLDVSDRLNSLGVLYLNHDRLTEAESLFKRSIEIAEKVLGFGHANMGIRIDNLVDSYKGQRRHAEAEQLLKSKAAATESALGQNHEGVAERLEALANFYVERDNQDQAERLYQRALAIYEKTLGADHLKVATTLGNLARLYRLSDRYDEAGLLAKRALNITERKLGGDEEMVAERQRGLAAIYREQKRYAEAEALLKQALAAIERLRGQDHADVAKFVNDTALLYFEQGRDADAELLYKRSLAILERAHGPDHHDVGRNSTNLGHVYYRQGRYADAEVHYKRALAIEEKNGAGPDDLNLAYRLHNLASLHLAQGDQTRASEYWRRSTDIMLRRIRRGTDDSVVSARMLAAEINRAKEQFVGLIRSQSYLDKLYRHKADRRRGGSLVDGALEFPFETIQWAQNSKAAASLAQMATRTAKGDAALAAITRERQDLVAEWQTLDVARNKIIAEPPDDRDSAEESRIATRLAAIDARIAEIDQRLKVEFPNFAALSKLEPLSMKEVQSLLRPDEAVILLLDTPEYGKSPGNTFIWVVAKDYDSYAPSNLSTTKLKRITDALRCGLDASLWDDDEKAKACRDLLNKEPQRDEAGNVRLDTLPFHTKLAHDLYRSFFSTLEESIKDKHLFIVAPGPLAQLPFHVLVTEAPKQGDDFRSVKWFARANSITVLPNVSALKALRRVGKPSIARKPMIGIGNPLLDGDRANAWEAKWAALARERQACTSLSERQQVAALTRSPRARPVVTRGGLADLAHLRLQVALPDTADELCTVAATLKAAPGDVWLGANATETSIKRLSAEGRLDDYRVVHFATHGTLAGEIEGATEPGLILTPPPNASDMDDGYLSASEVANLKLDADWVILSACNTAGAKDAEGEALSGLASAFFYAGSRALLVSHWAVASDAAVKLITRTVGATSNASQMPRAEALRRAMLSMIDEGQAQEAHPAIWAPFVLVGEGGDAR